MPTITRQDDNQTVPDVEVVPQIPWLYGKLRKLLRLPQRRFPFKTPPLRVPGQSAADECDDLIMSGTALVMIMLGFIGIWLYSTSKCIYGIFISEQPPINVAITFAINFSIITIIVGVFLVVPVVWFRSIFRKVENYRMGLLAERHIGQQLERSRRLHYSVFHDIIIDGEKKFNIDHVAIGPGGIFVVETKARSKPEKYRGSVEKITFDGKSITYHDGYNTDDPVRQVWRNSDWLRDKLTELLAKEPDALFKVTPDNPLPMRPLLVYPGWYIDYSQAKGTSLRVVNDAVLIDHIKGAYQQLTPEQVSEIARIFGEYLQQQRRNLLA